MNQARRAGEKRMMPPQKAKGKSEKDISDIFIKIGRIQFIIMSFILSAFIIFGQDFITLWAGSNYRETYTICLIFFIPMTVDLIQNIGLVILQARNQMKFRDILCIILGLSCFALSFPFAIMWGAIGCALAVATSLVAGQIIAMNIYYYRHQDIDIPHFWMEIGKMSIVPLCFTLATVIAIRYFDIRIETFKSLILYGFIYCLLYFPVFWKFSMNASEKDLILKPAKRFLRMSA